MMKMNNVLKKLLILAVNLIFSLIDRLNIYFKLILKLFHFSIIIIIITAFLYCDYLCIKAAFNILSNFDWSSIHE